MADNKKRLEEINALLKNAKITTEEKAKLLKEENSLLKDHLKLQSESLDLSSLMVDSIKEALEINTKRSTADSNILKVNKQINSAILNQVVGITSIADISKQIAKNQKVINKTKALEASLEHTILTSGKRNVKQRLGLVESASNLSMELDKEIKKREELEEAAGRGEKINKDALSNSNKMIGDLGAQLDNRMKFLSTEEKTLLFTKNNIKLLEKQNSLREIELKTEKKINKQLGLFGGILKGITKIPFLNKVIDTEKVLKKAKDKVKETNSGLKGMAAGFKEIGKQAIKGLLNPVNLALGAVTMLVAAIVSADKEAGELGKNYGISYKEALKVSGAAKDIAKYSKDDAVTKKGIMKSTQTLNTYYGTAVQLSTELAEEFTSIQKRTNLSDKAMNYFTKSLLKTGKSTKTVLLNIKKTVLEQNHLNKSALSVKQVQEDIAEISNTIKLTYKGSEKELTKVVFASKKLGASLSQIESIAEGLLDFESSIANQMNFQLISGKQLHLEAATAFALQGKTAQVAEEVMKNEELRNVFATDNVFLQKSAAKVLNMSRNDLANMIVEGEKFELISKNMGENIVNMSQAQDAYNESRKQGLTAEQASAKLGVKGLGAQFESLAMMEEMEKRTESMKLLFLEIAEVVLPIIQAILVPILFVFDSIVTGIHMFIDGLKKGSPIAAAFLGALIPIAISLVSAAASAIFAGFAMLGPAGPPLALLAIAGMMAKMSESENKVKASVKTGDAMGDADGKFTFSPAEGGLFEGSPNDQFVLAPGIADAAKASNKGSQGSNTSISDVAKGESSSQNNSALMAKIDQIIAINTRIAQVAGNRKQDKITLEMSGNEVGQGIQKADREIS